MNKILKLQNKDNKTGKHKTVGRMEIKNKTDEYAELFFYGDIVSSNWGKWENEDKCPQDVVDFLNEINGVKNIEIRINSGGGSVFAGLAIYNVLKRNSAYKTVYVDGMAASIASVIALAGDRIVIPKTAQYMIHKPHTVCGGNAFDFRKVASDLDAIEESILNVYEENLRDGVDMDIIKEMVDNETWLTGDKVAKYFNVEVTNEFDAVACTSDYFDRYNNVPDDLSCNNKLTQPPPITNKQSDNLKKQKLKLELDIL